MLPTFGQSEEMDVSPVLAEQEKTNNNPTPVKPEPVAEAPKDLPAKPSRLDEWLAQARGEDTAYDREITALKQANAEKIAQADEQEAIEAAKAQTAPIIETAPETTQEPVTVIETAPVTTPEPVTQAEETVIAPAINTVDESHEVQHDIHHEEQTAANDAELIASAAMVGMTTTPAVLATATVAPKAEPNFGFSVDKAEETFDEKRKRNNGNLIKGGIAVALVAAIAGGGYAYMNTRHSSNVDTLKAQLEAKKVAPVIAAPAKPAIPPAPAKPAQPVTPPVAIQPQAAPVAKPNADDALKAKLEAEKLEAEKAKAEAAKAEAEAEKARAEAEKAKQEAAKQEKAHKAPAHKAKAKKADDGISKRDREFLQKQEQNLDKMLQQ